MKGIPGLTSRGAALNRDWTSGSILGNLWSLSWPLLIAYSINALGPTVDMIWIGKLGAAPIAGVGISATIVVVVNSLVSDIFTGTSALIARFMGAKDEQSAKRAAQQAFVIGLAFSIFMALVGIFLAEPILRVLGVSPEVVKDAASYMRIQLIGIVTITAVTVAQSIMQSSGDTFTPMKISIGYRIFQIALCPALVFGWGFIPALGVSGASLSIVIAQAAGGSVALWYLFSGRSRLQVSLRGYSFDSHLIWRTVRIGIPAAISYTERAFADLLLVGFIIPFGTIAVAAHSFAQRLDMFIMNLGGGFGTAAGVLCGQIWGPVTPRAQSERAG